MNTSSSFFLNWTYRSKKRSLMLTHLFRVNFESGLLWAQFYVQIMDVTAVTMWGFDYIHFSHRRSSVPCSFSPCMHLYVYILACVQEWTRQFSNNTRQGLLMWTERKINICVSKVCWNLNAVTSVFHLPLTLFYDLAKIHYSRNKMWLAGFF